jgi:hypothetical protein
MLYTPTSSDSIPLLSSALPTSHSMSCGSQDRPLVVIHRPACEAFSFDWSDFPILQQDGYEDFPTYNFPKNTDNDLEPMSSRNDFPSTSSNLSLSTSTSSESSVSSSSSHRRRVSFADNIKVRTHSIVLGDHPCCRSLALELGWEYDESELALNDRRQRAARRRPYLERKEMLKRISGMTDAEIKFIVTAKLRPVGPSSRSLNTLGFDL